MRRIAAVMAFLCILGLPLRADAGQVLPTPNGSVAPTSVVAGGNITLTATCTVPPTELAGGTLIGFILDPAASVIVAISDGNWQINNDSGPFDFSRSTTIAAPTAPGSYTYQVTCGGLTSHNSSAVTFPFVVTGVPPETTVAPTTATPTATAVPSVDGTTATTTATATADGAITTTAAADGATTTATTIRASAVGGRAGQLPATGSDLDVALVATVTLLAGVALVCVARRRAPGSGG